MSENRLDQLIDSVGDGTGVTNQARQASDYFVIPHVQEVLTIVRVLIYIEDDAKFAGEKYSGATALTNGIKITKNNSDGIIHDFTPLPITKFAQWALLAGVDVILTDFTTGNDVCAVRWTLDKAGYPVSLDGTKGEFFKVSVRDSLAGLVDHRMAVQGYRKWRGHD